MATNSLSSSCPVNTQYCSPSCSFWSEGTCVAKLISPTTYASSETSDSVYLTKEKLQEAKKIIERNIVGSGGGLSSNNSPPLKPKKAIREEIIYVRNRRKKRTRKK